MKKLLPALLALSIAANAALIITRTAPPASPAATMRAADSKKAARATPALPDSAALATLHEKLIAAGIPESEAREILRSMLWRPFYDRQRAIFGSKNADKPYWQQSLGGKKQITSEERAELRALSEQIETRAAALLGEEPAARTASRFAFLSADKAAALHKLQRDYSEINDGVSGETSLFRLPSDEAAKRLLRQEQRRDLEAILTPAELAEYDLRYSNAAIELRKRFANLPDSTEDEYKTAYAIAQSAKGDFTTQTAATQQLRDLLGADRYNAFIRANDSDYAALQGAAARFDIPASTIDAVYGLRDQAVSFSQQIAADKNLSPSDKQQALKTLSSQLRKDVRANLGNEIGDAYLDKNMTWLKTLSNGHAINTTPMGKIVTKPVAKDKSGKKHK